MAEVETPTTVESSDTLASLTPTQREHWRLTGEVKAVETPAPAQESDSDDETPDETPKPAEPGPDEAVEKADAETPAPEAPKKGNPRKDREARMFQAIEREKAAVARAEAAERKAAELEARLRPDGAAAPRPPSQPQLTGDGKFVDYDGSVWDFSGPEDNWIDQFSAAGKPDPYASMSAVLSRREGLRIRQELAQEQQQAAVKERRVKLFDQTVAKYPDFRERLQDPDVYNLQIPEYIWKALETSSASAEILHHFSERPDEARRLAGLDPVAALLELGRFSAGPPNGTVPPRASTPSAPPPPVTLGSRPSQPDDPVTSALSAGDFRRYKDAANRRDVAGKR